jgi:hypothetical protein
MRRRIILAVTIATAMFGLVAAPALAQKSSVGSTKLSSTRCRSG